MLCLRDRIGANRLGDPRRGALEHLRRRLRSDVAGPEAGAARRQHERRLLRELGDRLGDRVAVVGHDPALDLVALAQQQLGEQIAALVLPGPLRDTVRDREHGGLHCLVFSNRRTSAISIPESSAFAMS